MRLLPYGREAVLIELDSPVEVDACRSTAAAVPGVVEVVAGACSVLVRAALADLPAVRAQLENWSWDAAAPLPTEPPVVEIAVRYDGPDLDWVASAVGLSVGQVISAHSSGDYVVRFLGFSPGFAYLDGLNPQLQVNRLETPRSQVPAGAVAIAGEFAAVYPRSSPGGWRILGTTDRTLWDLAADPPALLPPGTHVRFVPA